MAQQLQRPLGKPASPTGVLVTNPGTQIQFTLMFLGDSRWRFVGLGPCHPPGKLEGSSRSLSRGPALAAEDTWKMNHQWSNSLLFPFHPPLLFLKVKKKIFKKRYTFHHRTQLHRHKNVLPKNNLMLSFSMKFFKVPWYFQSTLPSTLMANYTSRTHNVELKRQIQSLLLEKMTQVWM